MLQKMHDDKEDKLPPSTPKFKILPFNIVIITLADETLSSLVEVKVHTQWTMHTTSSDAKSARE
jgi:hypothetical protein